MICYTGMDVSNMSRGSQMNDTHPAAEQVQIELLRKATVEQRLHLVRSLTATSRQMAWQAIRQVHPHATDEEIDIMFVALHYGQDLADRVRDYMGARK